MLDLFLNRVSLLLFKSSQLRYCWDLARPGSLYYLLHLSMIAVSHLCDRWRPSWRVNRLDVRQSVLEPSTVLFEAVKVIQEALLDVLDAGVYLGFIAFYQGLKHNWSWESLGWLYFHGLRFKLVWEFMVLFEVDPLGANWGHIRVNPACHVTFHHSSKFLIELGNALL